VKGSRFVNQQIFLVRPHGLRLLAGVTNTPPQNGCAFSNKIYARSETTMSKFSILAGGCLSVLLVGAIWAQDPLQSTPPQPQPKGARNLAKMLRQQDANSDGKLARAEWKGKPQVFDRLDQDRDGFLTPTEMADLGSQRRNALNKLDADNDGKVARTEWKGKPRGFDRLDVNGDGFLTAEELAQRRQGKRNDTPPVSPTPKPGL
jgi:hypothetical protein